MKGEFCETLAPKDSPKNLAVSSNNSMTLYWHAADAAERFPQAKGFRLHWFVSRSLRPGLGEWPRPTSATRRDALALSPDACLAGAEFACADGLTCLPAQLACDAERHCDDGSDLLPHLQLAAGCESASPVPHETPARKPCPQTSPPPPPTRSSPTWASRPWPDWRWRW